MNDLVVQQTTDDAVVTAVLSGSITEFSSFVSIIDGLPPPQNGARAKVVIDLGGIEHINSCGVREWINFLKTLEKMQVPVELWRCSVPMVRQMTMIPSMRGAAHLGSVLLPYYCSACDDDRVLLIDIPSAEGIHDEAPCPVCNSAMEFDDNVSAYQPLIR